MFPERGVRRRPCNLSRVERGAGTGDRGSGSGNRTLQDKLDIDSETGDTLVTSRH